MSTICGSVPEVWKDLLRAVVYDLRKPSHDELQPWTTDPVLSDPISFTNGGLKCLLYDFGRTLELSIEKHDKMVVKDDLEAMVSFGKSVFHGAPGLIEVDCSVGIKCYFLIATFQDKWFFMSITTPKEYNGRACKLKLTKNNYNPVGSYRLFVYAEETFFAFKEWNGLIKRILLRDLRKLEGGDELARERAGYDKLRLILKLHEDYLCPHCKRPMQPEST
jgi:hypothetical protein